VQQLHKTQLHKTRGRPRSLTLRVYERDLPDLSRRALYYRAAYDRVWCAMVENGLTDQREHVRGERNPLPLRVMYEIGKQRYPDDDVRRLAEQAVERLRQGWTTAQILYWLRE
jgi:hypothetical protein